MTLCYKHLMTVTLNCDVNCVCGCVCGLEDHRTAGSRIFQKGTLSVSLTIVNSQCTEVGVDPISLKQQSMVVLLHHDATTSSHYFNKLPLASLKDLILCNTKVFPQPQFQLIQLVRSNIPAWKQN